MKYPIGIQDFEKLRLDGFFYVDKTEDIYNLVKGGSYYFLSRPRRFGKSLLLSTIKAYFEGKRELFKGLFLYDSDLPWTPRPVFHLNFAQVKMESLDSLRDNIENHIARWEAEYDVSNTLSDYGVRIYNVIKKAYTTTGQRVAVLIDEYDKMLVNNLHNPALLDQIRAELKPIYGVMKQADEYITFGLITGVSRFSRMSIFSDINNLNDISLDSKYAAICGITEAEIRSHLTPGVERFAKTRGVGYEDMMSLLKQNYDGYHFAKYSPDIYNPFSLLSALQKEDLGHYWFETGTPSFLVESIIRSGRDLRDILSPVTTGIALANMAPTHDNLMDLMFQTGYLTIKHYDGDDDLYTLGIPNREVETGLLQHLLPLLNGYDITYNSVAIVKMRNAVRDGKPEEFLALLKSFLSGIPYNLSENKHEIYYENNLYVIFKLIGFRVASEYYTSEGRIDIALETPNYVYIIELKLDGTPEEALRQISDRHYSLPFDADSRNVIRIGINFSKTTRNIDRWLIER